MNELVPKIVSPDTRTVCDIKASPKQGMNTAYRHLNVRPASQLDVRTTFWIGDLEMLDVRKFCSAIFVLCALSISLPAYAAVDLTATYKGTVSIISGSGPVFSDVEIGDPWTATYAFDFHAGSSFFSDSGNLMYAGGIYNGFPTPVVSAALTIGGETRNFAGSLQGIFLVTSSGSDFGFISRADDGAIFGAQELFGNAAFFSGAIPFPFPGIQSFSGAPNSGSAGTWILDRQFIQASITDVTIASSVPEPSTWAMMIFGFAAVGFTLRRSARRNEGAVLPI